MLYFTQMKQKIFISDLSGKSFPISKKITGFGIHQSFLNFIQTDYPNFNESNELALEELNILRRKYVQFQINQAANEINPNKPVVITNETDNYTVEISVEEDELGNLTFGQKIADKVALFGGSWTFIITFFLFIALWIMSNIILLNDNGFDPFPFILLNLILSCIAAVQAPVIMMSQNRQEEKDRNRSKKDYLINLKAELEIRNLHEKIDQLMIQQHEKMLEIQQIQIDMLTEFIENQDKK